MPDEITIQNLEIQFEVEGNDDNSMLFRLIDERIEQAFEQKQKDRQAAKDRSLGDRPVEEC